MSLKVYSYRHENIHIIVKSIHAICHAQNIKCISLHTSMFAFLMFDLMKINLNDTRHDSNRLIFILHLKFGYRGTRN